MAAVDRIKFRCPKCRYVCRVPGSLAGQVGRCPGCKQALQVPGGSAVDDDGEPAFALVSEDEEPAFELASDSEEQAPVVEAPAAEPARSKAKDRDAGGAEPARSKAKDRDAGGADQDEADGEPDAGADDGAAEDAPPARSRSGSRGSGALEEVAPLPGLLKGWGILLILSHVGVFIWLAIRAVIGLQNDASLTLLAIHGVGLIACLVFIRLGAGILQQEWGAISVLLVMAGLMAIFALSLMPNAFEAGAVTLVGVALLYGVPIRLAHLNKASFRGLPDESEQAAADAEAAAAPPPSGSARGSDPYAVDDGEAAS